MAKSHGALEKKFDIVLQVFPDVYEAHRGSVPLAFVCGVHGVPDAVRHPIIPRSSLLSRSLGAWSELVERERRNGRRRRQIFYIRFYIILSVLFCSVLCFSASYSLTHYALPSLSSFLTKLRRLD